MGKFNCKKSRYKVTGKGFNRVVRAERKFYRDNPVQHNSTQLKGDHKNDHKSDDVKYTETKKQVLIEAIFEMSFIIFCIILYKLLC